MNIDETEHLSIPKNKPIIQLKAVIQEDEPEIENPMSKDTETIDRLFLELSQFTGATTGKELKLHADYERLKTDYKNLLETCRYANKDLAQARAVLEECRPMVKARLVDGLGTRVPYDDSILTRIEAALKGGV